MFIKDFIKKLVPIIGVIGSRRINIPMIYYHDICYEKGDSLQKTNFNVFRAQMLFLHEEGYQTLTFNDLDQYLEKKFKRNDKIVFISFDDGYKSNYEIVFPLMVELNLKFNIFINTKYIGLNTEYMSINNIKEMYESKLVGFGAHTHSHINCVSKSEKVLINEIEQCNDLIFDWLGYTPLDFCYPYGKYDAYSNNILSKFYRRIYTSDNKPLFKLNNSIVRGRIGISTDDSIKTFSYKLKGRYNIIYYYHKIKRSLSNENRKC